MCSLAGGKQFTICCRALLWIVHSLHNLHCSKPETWHSSHPVSVMVDSAARVAVLPHAGIGLTV